jgi:hypothetical protein
MKRAPVRNITCIEPFQKGFPMSLRRLALSLIAAVVLTACEDAAPPVDCSATPLCAEAASMAAQFNARSGEAISDQITLQGASAQGAMLTIDLSVPFSDEQIGGQDRQTLQQIGSIMLSRSFCAGGSFTDFIPRGGQVVQRVYSRDNRLLSSSFFNTCPGDSQPSGGQRLTQANG